MESCHRHNKKARGGVIIGVEITDHNQRKDGSWVINGVVDGVKRTAVVADEELQYYRRVSAAALHDVGTLTKLTKEQAEAVLYDACDRILGREHDRQNGPVSVEEMTAAAEAQRTTDGGGAASEASLS